MKCINKWKLSIPVIIVVCMLLGGCGEERTELKDAYKVFETSDSYRLTDSVMTEPVTLFAEDLCVGGTTNTRAKAVESELAESAAVFTVDNKEITYAKNIYEKRYPASTTKILTAYLAIKYGNMDDIVTVSDEAINSLMWGSSVCGIKPGDKISMENLMYGLMLCSGNDAANVIAEHISGSTEKFAELMNEEVAALGATQSHFVNAHGLPDEEHYTTAYDLYLIFNAAIKDENFVRYISAKEQKVSYEDAAGNPVEQTWKNTNGYLTEDYKTPKNITVIGGKTGTTNDAGSCLILLSNNKEKQPVISIVLKSDSRDHLYTIMSEMLTNFSN